MNIILNSDDTVTVVSHEESGPRSVMLGQPPVELNWKHCGLITRKDGSRIAFSCNADTWTLQWIRNPRTEVHCLRTVEFHK